MILLKNLFSLLEELPSGMVNFFEKFFFAPVVEIPKEFLRDLASLRRGWISFNDGSLDESQDLIISKEFLDFLKEEVWSETVELDTLYRVEKFHKKLI